MFYCSSRPTSSERNDGVAYFQCTCMYLLASRASFMFSRLPYWTRYDGGSLSLRETRFHRSLGCLTSPCATATVTGSKSVEEIANDGVFASAIPRLYSLYRTVIPCLYSLCSTVFVKTLCMMLMLVLATPSRNPYNYCCLGGPYYHSMHDLWELGLWSQDSYSTPLRLVLYESLNHISSFP